MDPLPSLIDLLPVTSTTSHNSLVSAAFGQNSTSQCQCEVYVTHGGWDDQ